MFDATNAERYKSLPIGICAGWVDDGAMTEAIEETGVPLLGWGPPAPTLDTDDELAWHPVDELPPRSMRRRRLVDVWRGVGPDGRTASAPLRVEVRFRDTYGEDDGTEVEIDVDHAASDSGAPISATAVSCMPPRMFCVSVMRQ